jgi:hypothetical protein
MATKRDGWVRLQREPVSRLWRLWMTVTGSIDRHIGWDKLPIMVGIPTLSGMRGKLREENLFDTGVPEVNGFSPTQSGHRSADGMWNDLAHPKMGAAGTNFGRNVRPADRRPEPEHEMRTPDPRTVSRALLTREQFIPATTLNVLAAAWLQFEVHDWFSHGKNEKGDPYVFPVEPGDPWPRENVIIERTRRGDTAGVFRSEDTHWWDGSQIYGSSLQQQKLLRDGARLKIQGGTVPASLINHFDFSGQQAGFWTGWAVLHTLFALEHNAICDYLQRREKRAWDDEELFQTARLVNVALMAKIHTTEWTPAVIAHRTTQRGMRMNWWGISERLKRSIGRISSSEMISGIVGSPTDHHGVPYSLTEEFVAVYRMHPLIPDDFVFRSPVGGGTPPRYMRLEELRTKRAIPVLQEIGMPTVLYSFGTSHPGAITLHNYPKTLQKFDREGELFDLAAVDIFRDRERRVPRYNDFRKAFRRAPIREFEQLSTHPLWVEEIRRVYDNDIDKVDLMIGLYAEPRPKGFAFSDTAFRVFLLMASRRLKSDRFFTECYNEQHYTRSGLDWIDNSSMKTVLLRHFRRELEDVLEPVGNAFLPWSRVAC